MPLTMGIPPPFPHGLHVEEVDVVVASDRHGFDLVDPPATDGEPVTLTFTDPAADVGFADSGEIEKPVQVGGGAAACGSPGRITSATIRRASARR